MPDLIKIAKFGGTSMADLTAMKRCAEIIKADHDKRIIVVSAVAGVTNLLTAVAAVTGQSERERLFKEIEKKHLDILSELKHPEAARVKVRQLLDGLKAIVSTDEPFDVRTNDELLSFGERLSSTIFTALLEEEGVGAEFLDAREVIRTNNSFGKAEPLVGQIRHLAEERVKGRMKERRLITQGFIGSDKTGTTTTLGRGGSDYSAALLAEALDADVLEIWTDVNAIFTTDPRIVPNAEPITEISFDEAAELSVFGAKVLHPATLKPAMRRNIRVYVGSSVHPEEPGTWIVKRPANEPVIRAISLRRDQTLVTVHSLDMLHRHGFLARLFQILADHKISVDLVTTSEVSVSLTIDTHMKGLNDQLPDSVIRELESIANVQVESGLALIALVGSHLDSTAGISGQLFNLLDDINIRLICHGASTHNLCFLIDDNRATDVISKLHSQFIEGRSNR